MTSNNRRVGWGAFPQALLHALQWRLLLLWVVFMALPTLVMSFPVSKALGQLLDHSVHAGALAERFDALYMSDVLVLLTQDNGWLGGIQIVSLVITLLLSLFLTGMVLTAVRSARRARLGELMRGGLSQYWRMLRLMLWGLVLYAIAGGVGAGLFKLAATNAEHAVLQSDADFGRLLATIAVAVLLVLAHAILESARAQLAAHENLRSATRAFGWGIAMLVRRPLVTLSLYLGTSIVGYTLVLLVGMLRIRIEAVGGVGYLAALLLAQLIVVILAWQRTARISALTMVAHATPPRQRAKPDVEKVARPGLLARLRIAIRYNPAS